MLVGEVICLFSVPLSLLGRINSVLFYLLWITAPILISVISFFAYVMQGNTLSISVAFTASILDPSRGVHLV